MRTGAFLFAEIARQLTKARVNDALENFREWAHPWEYIHTALKQHGLQSDEIELIKELWSAATDPQHWVRPSFQSSKELIFKSLTTDYPWLSTGSIDALFRGASYVWK